MLYLRILLWWTLMARFSVQFSGLSHGFWLFRWPSVMRSCFARSFLSDHSCGLDAFEGHSMCFIGQSLRLGLHGFMKPLEELPLAPNWGPRLRLQPTHCCCCLKLCLWASSTLMGWHEKLHFQVFPYFCMWASICLFLVFSWHLPGLVRVLSGFYPATL